MRASNSLAPALSCEGVGRRRGEGGSMSRRDGSETGRNIIKFNVLVYGPRSPAITSPRYLLGNREAILYTPIQTSLETLPSPPPRSPPTFAALFRAPPFPIGFSIRPPRNVACSADGFFFLTGRKLPLVDRGVRGEAWLELVR